MTRPTAGGPGSGRDRAGESPQPRLARRALLRGLAGGGAAATLVARQVGAAGAAGSSDRAGAEGDHRRLGFRATDHTRWFCHRARW